MTECDNVDCPVDDPGRIYAYELDGTGFRGFYCGRHDPRQNTVVGDQWRLLDAVVV